MRWYVSIAGNTQGPFEEATLVDKLRRGELAGASHVAQESSQSWQPIDAHPAFRAALSARAPASPAQPAAGGGLKVAATMAMDAGAFAEAMSQAGVNPAAVGSSAGYAPQPSHAGYSPAPQPGGGGYPPAQAPFPQPGAYPGSQPGAYHAGSQPGSYPGVGPYGGMPGSQPGFAPPSNVAPTPASGGNNKIIMIVVGVGCGMMLLVTLCGVLGAVVRSM